VLLIDIFCIIIGGKGAHTVTTLYVLHSDKHTCDSLSHWYFPKWKFNLPNTCTYNLVKCQWNST